MFRGESRKENNMACNKYCDCFYCAKDENCPLDHYGDGSPYCKEFECNYAYCKRTECISYEDQLEEC